MAKRPMSREEAAGQSGSPAKRARTGGTRDLAESLPTPPTAAPSALDDSSSSQERAGPPLRLLGGGPATAMRLTPAEPFGEAPIPPPDDIQKLLPVFAAYGQHNCGQHVSHRAAAPGLLQPPAPSSPVPVVCRDCWSALADRSAVHVLPCGHALCQPCLRHAVDVIVYRLYWNWDVVARHLCASFYGAAQAAQAHRNRALAAAGFLCCGQRMHLGVYMPCMDPLTAEQYWLGRQLMAFPPDRTRPCRCAWPDCQVFLSPTCAYVRRGVQRYYCVHCGGNSMLVSRMRLIPAP